jgi:Flp pilus assembly protein TadD
VLGLAPKAEAADRPGGDIAAYDLFLQGLWYLHQPRTPRSLDAAGELFERALAKQPDFARAQAGLCETQVERYLLERVPAHVAVAERACARAQSLDDGAYEVHEAVGSLRLVTGDPAGADAAYRRALAIAPRSADALIGLAAAQADAGDPEEAERTLARAIAAQPRYAASYMEYGSLLFRQGRPRDAIAPFEHAAQLEPGNAGPFNNLGAAYLYAGDFDRAAEAFSKSLALEPRPSSYSNTGLGLYYHGQYEEAAKMFRQSTELAPADHRVWGNLADALRAAGHEAEAGRAYARALELAEGELAVNPRHALNQALTAYYASRLRDADRARRSIGNALAAGGDDNEVHFYVGLAALGLGDRATAVEQLRRARELGYPEPFLKSAPELAGIRDRL